MATDLPASFHYEAFAEPEHTKFWDKNQAEGLGKAFFQEIQLTVSHIQEAP